VTCLPALIISTIRTREVTSKNQHPALSRADNERVSIPLTNQIDCGIDRLRAVLEVACTRSCASAMLRSPVVVITRACLPDLMRELVRVAADGLGMAALCVGEQRLHGSHRDHGGGVDVVEAREIWITTNFRRSPRGAASVATGSPSNYGVLHRWVHRTPRAPLRQPLNAPPRHAVPPWTTGTRYDRFRTYGARPRWTPFCARRPGGGSPARPSLVYSYVRQGEIRSQLEGQPARTFQTGQSWSEPPGSHHMLTENTSASASTRLLVVFVAGAGLKTDDR
jgi:hypothetical protein